MSETGMTNMYIGQNNFLPKQLKNTQVYFSKQSPHRQQFQVSLFLSREQLPRIFPNNTAQRTSELTRTVS